MKKIKIAIIDDHQLFREGLSHLMETIPQLQIIGMYQNGKELIEFLNDSKELPEVLLMDIEMPIMNGFQTLVQINIQFPDIGVIFLSAHANVHFIEKAIKLGAFGFLTKDSDIDALEIAIEKAKAKKTYFNNYITPELWNKCLKGGGEIVFTKREIEYLQLLCEHKTDREIAQLMFISKDTAISYRKKLMQKIGINKVTELFAYAIEHKLVE